MCNSNHPTVAHSSRVSFSPSNPIVDKSSFNDCSVGVPSLTPPFVVDVYNDANITTVLSLLTATQPNPWLKKD